MEYPGLEVRRGVFKLEVEILSYLFPCGGSQYELTDLIEKRNNFNGKHRKCGKTELEVGVEKSKKEIKGQ